MLTTVASTREPSQITVPIPRFDDLIDMVGRCRGQIFTTLDLMKDYQQIKMSLESKDKTAFTCHVRVCVSVRLELSYKKSFSYVE